MSIVFLVVGLVVIGAALLLAGGRLGELGPISPDRSAVLLPTDPVTPQAIANLRFAVGFRGYRMDEVDAVLDRLARELVDRDLESPAGGMASDAVGAPRATSATAGEPSHQPLPGVSE